jgi:hypothetical protein
MSLQSRANSSFLPVRDYESFVDHVSTVSKRSWQEDSAEMSLVAAGPQDDAELL